VLQTALLLSSCDGVFFSGSLLLCEIVIVLVVTDIANKFFSLPLSLYWLLKFLLPAALSKALNN